MILKPHELPQCYCEIVQPLYNIIVLQEKEVLGAVKNIFSLFEHDCDL